ncbi:MAG TPA: DUF559 domain-containing protein [Nocardioides sp.]|uniref:endonuclease domain-containing protein n=1 Tax=Nocardioides sp. TaxID=35761 RepID=UPI002CAB4141|nr:DUF559 domain-containing protein [Nocardioides sp.]HQR27155.1 DUF559 domain-containing protein [Nocardioides sp.]
MVISRYSVICDRTAAWVLGVDVFAYGELDAVPDIESCVLRDHRATQRQGVFGSTRDLKPGDWLEIDGIRVTTPLRTAMDLGCVLGRRDALAAMDALARRYTFTIAEMQQQLPRYFRRRGVVQLRELVPLVDGRSESMGESWTRLEIIDLGLPTPVSNHWVMVDGVPRFRLDLAYPRARICIEYDGEEFHSTEAQRAHDEARREWLRRHGWCVIVLTKDSFTPEALRVWTEELRDELRRRTQRPRPAYRRLGVVR